MSCNTSLTEILKSCDNNIGGLTTFLIAPAEFVTGMTASTGTISAISMSGASQFVEFQFNKNSASYTDEAAIDLTNGSTYFTQTVSLTIPRREVAKRQSLALVAAGQRDLKIIVKDGNGIYWFVGYANSANLATLGDGSGAAKADGSKYVMTFVAEEPDQMYVVDSTIIAGIS